MLTEQIKESKNVISNEYEYSTNLLNCQSEFNQEIQKRGPNEAERRAKIEERKRMEKEAQKKKEYNNNMNKYMTNIRMHKFKEEQKKKEEEAKKQERQKKLNDILTYNKRIRNYNLSKDKHKSKHKKSSSRNKSTDLHANSYHSPQHSSRESNQYTFKKNEENQKVEFNNENIERETNIQVNESNVEEEKKQITVDITHNINTALQEKINTLNTHSRTITSKEHFLPYYSAEDERKELDEDIQSNLQQVNIFRKKGLITSRLPTAMTEESVKRPIQKTKKPFVDKKDRETYIKALKHIMTERLGEKKIIIPNICSCGQLQRKLEAVVEAGNISVLKVSNFECANNCIYYKKPKEYEKCIKELVSIIKKLKYSSFNNKYKEY